MYAWAAIDFALGVAVVVAARQLPRGSTERTAGRAVGLVLLLAVLLLAVLLLAVLLLAVLLLAALLLVVVARPTARRATARRCSRRRCAARSGRRCRAA